MTAAGTGQGQIQRIAQLMQQGNLQAAAQSCATLLAAQPQDPAGTHLMGLIREQGGDPVSGEQLLRNSISLDGGNAHFHLNLANMLRRQNRYSEAEVEFRRVLDLAPRERGAQHGLALTLIDLKQFDAGEAICRNLLRGFASDATAWKLLAFALSEQQRLPESETAYRRALALEPGDALAHHNLGSVLSRMERAEAALDSLDKACQLGLRGLELHVNRGRTLALLYRMEEAEREFVTAVGLDQTHIDAQVNLARLRYMRGDAAFARDFRIAADAHLAYLALQTSYLTVLRCAGLFDLAQTHLQRLMDHHGPLPALRAQLAQVLQVADRLPEAELQALAAAAGDPGSTDIIETLVLIQLAGGKAAEAREHILRQRSGRPNAQNWLAYEASALRLLGDPAYRQLVDYDRHVRCFEVQPPTGWRSIAHFNADLLQALKQRHPFASHPLDQSLRHGSQTTRNLLAETDAIIRAALDAFAPPLRDYVAGIGQAATHPLSARSTGAAAMVGAWSVRLHRDGFHVNHVHPEGWISSAYYVDVPDEVRDVNLRSGWLKFGEPRFAIPGAVPEHFVQPRQGLLVLFPSFVWHGTNAIRGDAPRTSIAFDAVPVPLV